MADGEDRTVRDPEEIINQRRAKSIFDIRDDMREKRKMVRLASHDRSTDISIYEAKSAYRALVDSYIIETEGLMRHYEPGPELLNSRDLGIMEIRPRVVDKGNATKGRHINRKYTIDTSRDRNFSENQVHTDTDIDAKYFEFEGLLSLLEAPDPLQAQWEIEIYERFEGTTNKVHTVIRQVNYSILDNMVRSINNFLADIGFEIDPEQEQDTLEL